MQSPSPLVDPQVLADIWQDQSPAKYPVQDLTHPCPLASPAPAAQPAPEVAKAAEALRQGLGWPDWVRLYPKPASVVVALNRLARDRGLPRGVVWMAPGTGAPLKSPAENPGVAILRADWAPDAASMAEAEATARGQGMLVALDESCTGFRLSPGGARQAMGLDPDAVILGPGLTTGHPLAALAGRGPAPPEGKPPAPEALAELTANLPHLTAPGLADRLEALGRGLVQGLRHFIRVTGQIDAVTVEGPPAMPRLGGRRMWAFIELAKEEGLVLGPLLLINDCIDGPGMRPALVRVARALARLRVLPEGEKAPLGWKDAAQPTSCARVEEMLASLDD